MSDFLIERPMRLFFLVSGGFLWLGLWLSGFDQVHWLLYVPALFFAFAALTGICPGLIISRWLLRPRSEQTPDSTPE